MGNRGIIDMPIKPTLDLDKVSKYIETQAVHPAMCYYMEKKVTQIAPSQIQDIQNTLRKELASARNIIVIGVRPNPEDTHIWDVIAGSQHPLYYVSPSKEDFMKWSGIYRKGRPSHQLACNFQTSIDLIIDLVAKS